jgi:hypothetical protein
MRMDLMRGWDSGTLLYSKASQLTGEDIAGAQDIATAATSSATDSAATQQVAHRRVSAGRVIRRVRIPAMSFSAACSQSSP